MRTARRSGRSPTTRQPTSRSTPVSGRSPSQWLSPVASSPAPDAGRLFGGIPATGAIARTAVNVRAGGSSKLAALVHALMLAAVIYTVAPLVSLIPLAALAGVLLATAVRMIELASLRALARSTRGDA